MKGMGRLENKIEIIRDCYLFAGVDPKCLEPLARASSIRRYESGRVIFQRDDEADGLRVILSGEVRIWIADSQGREFTLAFMGEGDPFGEIALLDGLKRTANAASIETTDCLFLPTRAVEIALARDALFARQLVYSLCETIRINLATINSFAFVGLDARLAGKLHELALDHAEIEGGAARFSRQFSQTDLAQLLGVSREAVNKQFRALKHDGLVLQDSGRLTITDLGALAARAQAAESLFR